MCITISVQGVILFIDPEPSVLVQTPNGDQPFAGYGLTLMCFVMVNNISDKVTVAATWFKDGIEFNINWDSRISVTPVEMSGDRIYMTSLHLMPLSSEDSGNYQCTATVTGPSGYSLANATNTTTLEVEGT